VGGSEVSESFSTLFEDFDGAVPLHFQLGLGGTLGKSFLLGADIGLFYQGGSRSPDDMGFGISTQEVEASLAIVNANAVGTFFPFGDGLYVKFGGGFSRLTYSMSVSGGDDLYGGTTGGSEASSSSNGYGIETGVGFALGFGGAFHLIGDFQFSKQWYSEEGLDSTHLLTLMLGLGWY